MSGTTVARQDREPGDGPSPDASPIAGSATAAVLATPRVPVCASGETCGGVRARLAGRTFDCADDVVVLAGDRLDGFLPIERLLDAGEGTPVAAVMDNRPPRALPDADPERVARQLVQRGDASIPVACDDGTFVGVIPAERLLEVLLRAHDEDLARLGGYLARAQQARTAAQESLARRLAHRLPWLLVGLAGAMLSALLVGAFEDDLRRNVTLAVFVPAIVYIADAVGTQTEALLIRGLAARVDLRVVLGREAATGVLVGLLLAAAFLPFAWVVWGDARVAAAVAVALVAACATATIVAIALPLGLDRLGSDPAFGSGPLATVVQDLLSLLTYFAVASVIVL